MISAFSFLFEDAPPARSVDEAWLAAAFDEAVLGVGRTHPNPPVGAVVVKDGAIIARGFHERAGSRHAEVVALDAVSGLASGAAAGSTVAVTLEPCTHHGRTPPCVDRLLQERVGRVLIGALDPNPLVHGSGVRLLRAAGIDVVVPNGAVADRCAALIAPFSSWMGQKRPYVIAKVGTSLDGRIAASGGASRWVTGPASRALVHRLRRAVDGIVVGAGTVSADDPELTARVDDGAAAHHPRRIVLDRHLDVQPHARVYASHVGDETPRALALHEDGSTQGRERLRAHGVDVLALADLDPATVLAALAGQGFTSLLLEPGPRLLRAFLSAGLVDELWWFSAPVLLGGDGVSVVGPLGVADPGAAPRFLALHRVACGDDVLTVYRPWRSEQRSEQLSNQQ